MSPLERLSGIALRHLDRERFEALRDRYMTLRGRMAPVLRLVHGSFGVEDLRQHLEQRIGRDFEILMVHSSVNHMRPMFTGEPLALLRMLMDYCGPDRTLVMPAFYFGEPGMTVMEVFRRNPRVDLRRLPSQMGLLTELFRRSAGVVQSHHPVYRVAAFGPLAEELTRGHENATGPAGRGSPFEFMAARDTCIIGLGKPMQVLTQAHHTEGAMGDEYPLPWEVGDTLSMTLVDKGRETPFQFISKGVKGRFNIWKLRQIMAPGTLQEWKFHHVPMFSTRARSVTEQCIAAARRGVTLYEPV